MPQAAHEGKWPHTDIVAEPGGIAAPPALTGASVVGGRQCRKTAGHAAATALVPFALIGAAQAQERPVDVPETVVEDAAVDGLRVGPGWIAYPRVSANLRYDTNIYNRTVATDDFIATVRPAVRLASDFSRHAAIIDLSAEARRYFDTSAENSEQWAARGEGRLDMAERYTLSTVAGVARRIERRGTLGDEFLTDRPLSYTDKEFGLTLARKGAKLEISATVATRKLDYNDSTQGGLMIDQSFRDVRRDSAVIRADYRQRQRLGFFGVFRANRLGYDLDRTRGSKGFSILGGLRYDVTDLLRVEAGAGYVRQVSRTSGARLISSPDFQISAEWTPRPRVRLRLDGQRSVERGPLPAVSTVLETTLVGTGTYALGSKTLIGVEAGVIRDDFRGIVRRDTRWYVEGKASHSLTPGISAVVGAGYRRQSAFGPDSRDYHGAQVRAGINLAF